MKQWYALYVLLCSYGTDAFFLGVSIYTIIGQIHDQGQNLMCNTEYVNIKLRSPLMRNVEDGANYKINHIYYCYRMPRNGFVMW